MQTFLPYPDFEKTARCLDWRRLGKQRVECMQILNALRGASKGWINHPAVRMWRGFEDALETYQAAIIDEWVRRGYKNNMTGVSHIVYSLPTWFGDADFHTSHQSNLLRKDHGHYSQFFDVRPDLEYIWPS